MINKDGSFDGIPLPSADSGLLDALSVWEKYQARVFGWNNLSTFFAAVPYQWQSYYQNTIYPCICFAQGYDPTIHGLGRLISTRTGCVVVRTLVDQIMSGDVQFEDKTGDGTAAGYVQEWAHDIKFVSFLYKLVTFTVSGGVALAKINVTEYGELWLDALRIDRYFADIDSKGNVTRATCYISVYEETVPGGKTKNWFLVERRFFKDGRPIARYELQPLEGLVNSPVIPSNASVPWAAAPEEVQNAFVRDYGTARLGEDIVLPFVGLGCSIVKNTMNSIVVPDTRFGDSALLNIIPYLIGIDQAFTNMINDQYLGAGWVYAPASIGDEMYTDGLQKRLRTYHAPDGSTSAKAEVVQFDIRAEQWQNVFDMYLRLISSAVGISANTLSSHLASDAASKTVSEIASENNKTTNMVENKRFLLSDGLAPLLREVLAFKGISGEVAIRFSRGGLTNMRNLVELTMMQYNAGLMSLEQAIEDLHPDWTKEQIDREVQLCRERDNFNLEDYVNDYSEQTAQPSGFGVGGSGDEDQAGGER